MMSYTEMKTFLEEVNKTHDEIEMMWKSLYDSNWKIRNLTDGCIHWTELNEFALKSLIKIWEEQQP